MTCAFPTSAISSSATPAAVAWSSGGRLAIQLRDIGNDGRLDPRTLHRYDLPDLAERYFAHPGDVLFRSRGDHATATTLGDDLPEPAAVIFPLIIVTPKTDRLDGQYLAWAINQPRAQRHFDACAQGQSLRMISRPCLEALEIDLPDLATQRAVVALDALSRQEARLATRLADLRHRQISILLADAAQRHAMEPA